MAKIPFKKGDTVEIIAGNDKGTQAEVLKVMPKDGKVIVAGCKIAKKTVKPSEENPKGGFMNKEMPMDISNVKKVEA